jgi:DNA-binding NtrC family response regulator
LRSLLCAPIFERGAKSVSGYIYLDTEDANFILEDIGVLGIAANWLYSILKEHEKTESLEKQNLILKESSESGYLNSTNPEFQNLLDSIVLLAKSNNNILLYGESGTGKNTIARMIHENSEHQNSPIVYLNLAEGPAVDVSRKLFGYKDSSKKTSKPSQFEIATHGTLFLEGIGKIDLDFQTRLFRVLQEKMVIREGSSSAHPIDCRIIAGTDRDLERMVEQEKFRVDLYHLIAQEVISIPSLRKRKEDIEPLIRHFINWYSHRTGKEITGIDNKALRSLLAYKWPGNVKELQNLIERAVLVCQSNNITLEDFKISLPDDPKLTFLDGQTASTRYIPDEDTFAPRDDEDKDDD